MRLPPLPPPPRTHTWTDPPPPFSWESLRFLVHFLGDIHQPLHLTSRERGGNGDPVLWEGRRTNLHSLWDGLLIARALREQSNYTAPLPRCAPSRLWLCCLPRDLPLTCEVASACSKQIESALTGRIYDPFIRLLLWEGVRTWWRLSLPTWFTCAPSSLSPSPPPSHPAQLVLGSTTPAVEQTVCPVTWATDTHGTTCAMGFPDGYDEHGAPPVEAGGTSEFYRHIRGAVSSFPSLTLPLFDTLTLSMYRW